MAKLSTPICDRLGIEFPVFQAGMGFVARAELAAAVSEAGGLGVIGAGSNLTPEELRAEIRGVRERTDKPFGVDILFATIRAEGETVARYTDAVHGMVEVVLEERVPVLVSGLGSPEAVVPRAHERGIYVMSVVGAVRHAVKAVEAGVDAVIASGCDGGGHVGLIGTAVLIPAVVDAVDVPVLAGGGLSDGRGLAAALSFGAQGAWLGTRFIATKESYAHDNYKTRIADTDAGGTVVTRAHSGKPCREAEIQPFPLQAKEVGEPASVLGRHEGDTDNGVLPAGQGCGLIHAVPHAADVVADIVREASDIMRRMQSFVG